MINRLIGLIEMQSLFSSWTELDTVENRVREKKKKRLQSETECLLLFSETVDWTVQMAIETTSKGNKTCQTPASVCSAQSHSNRIHLL